MGMLGGDGDEMRTYAYVLRGGLELIQNLRTRIGKGMNVGYYKVQLSILSNYTVNKVS